jgi:hypothetical protein
LSASSAAKASSVPRIFGGLDAGGEELADQLLVDGRARRHTWARFPSGSAKAFSGELDGAVTSRPVLGSSISMSA